MIDIGEYIGKKREVYCLIGPDAIVMEKWVVDSIMGDIISSGVAANENAEMIADRIMRIFSIADVSVRLIKDIDTN